jgi:hypothetical protein
MTIQFNYPWNGMDGIKSLSGAEETRLVGLGVARYYTPFMDGGPSDSIAVLDVKSDRRALHANLKTAAIAASLVPVRKAMAAPPTVTADGGSLPVGQSVPFLRSAFPTFFRESGGAYATSQANFTSAIINSSGTRATTFARVGFFADAVKVTCRLVGTTVPYRFIVDGEYVSLAGTQTSGTSGTQYITLDFTSVGGRAMRLIEVELQQDCGWVGAYVGATERCYTAPDPAFRTASLGDSYVVGSAATVRGDGLHCVIADALGWRAHTTSGSGGTGWVVASGAYTFGQRIANGDLSLGGMPSAVILGGSVNDRTSTAEAVQAAVDSGLRDVRGIIGPHAPIFMLGVFNPSIMSGAALSAAAMETAIESAVTAVADPLVFFIPITNAYGGAWLTTANTAALTADTAHLNNYACIEFGKKAAAEARASILAL